MRKVFRERTFNEGKRWIGMTSIGNDPGFGVK